MHNESTINDNLKKWSIANVYKGMVNWILSNYRTLTKFKQFGYSWCEFLNCAPKFHPFLGFANLHEVRILQSQSRDISNLVLSRAKQAIWKQLITLFYDPEIAPINTLQCPKKALGWTSLSLPIMKSQAADIMGQVTERLLVEAVYKSCNKSSNKLGDNLKDGSIRG